MGEKAQGHKVGEARRGRGEKGIMEWWNNGVGE